MSKKKTTKLGYTWYPKDWGNSEAVFELNLSERGLYREIIDLAMLNDNKIIYKESVWIRKFNITKIELDKILTVLTDLKLIEFKKDLLSVPSCESRLNLVRGGSNGGKKSKPIHKPIHKPFESLSEKKDKPIPNQIEIETKREIEIETIKEEILNSQSWLESILIKRIITLDKGVKYLKTFLDLQEDLTGEGNGLNRDINEIKNHFVKWLDIEIKKEKEKPKAKGGYQI